MPDFLVEYEGGRIVIIEVKDPSRLDSNEVQRKRKAAEILPAAAHGLFNCDGSVNTTRSFPTVLTLSFTASTEKSGQNLAFAKTFAP